MIRRGLRFAPFVVGGDQERARRGGLENLPAAIGFGAAASALCEPGRLKAEITSQRRITEAITEAATSVDRRDDPRGPR